MTYDNESPWFVGREGSQHIPTGWQTQLWATPFSGFRWAVPWVETETEKAIYCDSDFIFLSDLKNLWEQEFDAGKAVMAKGGSDGWRYCLSFWNIPVARSILLPLDRLKALPEAHRRMMALFATNQDIVQQFEGNWNCIDGEYLPIDKIDALHYSDMGTQLHHKYAMPRIANEGKTHWFDEQVRPHHRSDLQELFDQYYNEALESGMKVEDYIPSEEVYIVKESQKGYGTVYKAHTWSK